MFVYCLTVFSQSTRAISLFIWMKIVLLFFLFFLKDISIPGGGEGGGGGTLFFSAYVGSDPASTVHPKKISGISSTPKKYLKF